MSDARVQRWATVAAGFCGHRAEPLIAERLWCFGEELPDGRRGAGGWLHEAGYDGEGRVVVVRHTPPPEGGSGTVWWETVVYGRERIEVELGEGRAVTLLDGHGRPLRTEYHGLGGEDAETYHYDADGRLVAIDESVALGLSVVEAGRGEGVETGGRVTVEHDDRGVAVRIVDHQFGPLVIWDRAAEPWERCGERGLGALRDEAVRGIAEAVPSDAFAVFRLVLDYTGGMGVAPWVRVGPAADRPAWDAPRPAGSAWWSALRVGRPLLVDPAFDEDLCWRLERAAAFHQPDDPARFVLDGLAALLARHDWSGVLRPTDDFVVYTAMHDQGWDEQLASLRAVNPPERVGLWERRWLGS